MENLKIMLELLKNLNDVLKSSPNYDKLSEIHLEAFHMIFHKIARICCGNPNHLDSVHDIIGYSKLLEKFLIDVRKK